MSESIAVADVIERTLREVWAGPWEPCARCRGANRPVTVCSSPMPPLRAMAEAVAVSLAPIPMVLHCPACGDPHVDKPEPDNGWTNPPHRSHKCQGCGLIWRPADVPTVGVAAIATRGQADHDVPPPSTRPRSSGTRSKA